MRHPMPTMYIGVDPGASYGIAMQRTGGGDSIPHWDCALETWRGRDWHNARAVLVGLRTWFASQVWRAETNQCVIGCEVWPHAQGSAAHTSHEWAARIEEVWNLDDIGGDVVCIRVNQSSWKKREGIKPAMTVPMYEALLRQTYRLPATASSDEAAAAAILNYSRWEWESRDD